MVGHNRDPIYLCICSRRGQIPVAPFWYGGGLYHLTTQVSIQLAQGYPLARKSGYLRI
jgi:hypothetical protein